MTDIRKKMKSAELEGTARLNVANTPNCKRQNEELEPNTPSPGKPDGILKVKESELLSQIKRIVTEVVRSELNMKVEEIEAKVEANTDDIKQMKADQKIAITEVEEKLSAELERTKDENKLLKEELLKLETHKRKMNLKFSNIIDKQGETADECERQVLKMLQMCGLPMNTLSITHAYRVGFITKETPFRQMIVGFHHPKQRNQILYNGKKLKELCKVSVEEDFPEEVEQRRRTLLPIFREAKKTTRARLHDDVLTLSGKKYTLQNLHSLPEHLQPEQIATKVKGNMICFFTFLSSFSNHHKCNFTMRNTDFNCSEQAFMYSKAKLFKDEEIASKILKCQDPRRQKKLGRQIADFSEDLWSQHKDRIMFESLTAKYEQNPHLREILKSTGNKTLIECNPGDTYWGIGLDIQNKDAWEPSKWRGRNRLGVLLGEIRDAL